MNKMKKIISLFLIVLILISNYGFKLVSYSNEKSDVYLTKIGTADKHLKYYREESGMDTYVVCSIVGYTEDDEFYPAYCMDKKLPGAETSEYTVDLEEITPNSRIIKNSNEINNNAIWRIIKNGYPYKTAEEMGLDSDFDAFAVTKFAIYCILGESDIDYYSCDDDDEIGNQMLDKLEELVDIGLNGSETLESSFMTIEKEGKIYKENDNYIQKYKINSSMPIKEELDIEIMNNENITVQKEGNTCFYVIIPESSIGSDIELEFRIKAELKKYPVFYGITTVENTQDYIVTAEEFSEVSEEFKSRIETNNSKIEILKIDQENLNPISDTKIQLLDENRNIIQEKITDKNGKIVFENLYKGKYILKEIEANPNYVINDEETNINVQFNETKKVEIKNTYKKGNVIIKKIDFDTFEPIAGVKFLVINSENNEKIEEIESNENGEAITSYLPINKKYIIREKEPKEGYKALEKDIIAIPKWNKETIVTIANAKEIVEIENEEIEEEPEEVEGIKKLPRTGF